MTREQVRRNLWETRMCLASFGATYPSQFRIKRNWTTKTVTDNFCPAQFDLLVGIHHATTEGPFLRRSNCLAAFHHTSLWSGLLLHGHSSLRCRWTLRARMRAPRAESQMASALAFDGVLSPDVSANDNALWVLGNMSPPKRTQRRCQHCLKARDSGCIGFVILSSLSTLQLMCHLTPWLTLAATCT